MDAKIGRICLAIEELKDIPSICDRFELDFDDAYQYISATKYNYELVSFDKDFDRTDKGRKSPLQAYQMFIDKTAK